MGKYKTQTSITLDTDDMEKIDFKRGSTSRSEYLRKIIKDHLNKVK